jgi:cobalamin biosynthesis Mg chelatase CobN
LKIAKAAGVTVLTEEGRINAEGSVEAKAAPAPSTDVQASAEVSTPSTARAETKTEARAEPSVSTNPVVENPPEATVSENRAQTPVGTSGAQKAQENTPVASKGSAELPRTASPLAFSGLLGLLSLAGALGLRVTRH